MKKSREKKLRMWGWWFNGQLPEWLVTQLTASAAKREKAIAPRKWWGFLGAR